MAPHRPEVARQRVMQIAALGLVWGIGVVALVTERAGGERGRRDDAVATAAIVPASVPAAAEAPAPDCLTTAATGSIDIWGGTIGGDCTHTELFQLTWNERQSALSLLDGQLSLTVPVDRDVRRRFVAALANVARLPADGGGGCSALQFMDLTWRCDAALPMHAAFKKSLCLSTDDPSGAEAVHRVEQELVLFFRTAAEDSSR